jgi:cation:H+ antiporter
VFEVTLFSLGVLGLWGGTLLTISGAVQLSERHGLSHGFIGLTILAIGTDLPELLVGISGGVQQLRGIEASGVIVGNATGSAIAQGTLVLGVAGLVGYLPVATRMVRRDGLVLILALAFLASLGADGRMGRLEGSAMLIAYLMYFVALVQAESQNKRERPEPVRRNGLPPAFTGAVGLVTVLLAAHVVVTEGVALAASLGVSQTLLGVIVIAGGTSLPELVLSIGAALKGHATLSVGNVIGSNVFDLLVPVGVAAIMHPVVIAENTLVFDLPALAMVTFALLFFLVRNKGLQRGEAVALLALYVGYASLRLLVG